MSVSLTITGVTRFGKSNAGQFFALEQIAAGATCLYIDPQPKAAGEHFVKACHDRGFPVVHENLDLDEIIPCDFASPKNDPVLDRLQIENLCQIIGSSRGFKNVANHVQIMQHAVPFILCKMYSGLPFHELKHAWYSVSNVRLMEQCDHPDCTKWLLSRPSMKSTLSREMDPAIRFMEPLTHGPSVQRRDVGISNTVELLNSGRSLAVTGGRRISAKELQFLCSYRILEVVQAAVAGNLKKEVFIVIDESEILGIPPLIAQSIQSHQKYGIAFCIICQEPQWDDTNYPTTDVVMQNTDHLWFRCNAESIIERAVKDLAAVFDPYLVKRKRSTFRQAVRGYEWVDTESVTKRENDESVTSGRRERPIYHSWTERHDDYMPLNEQAALLGQVIAELDPGECIAKVGGEIDCFSLPEIKTSMTDEGADSIYHRESKKWPYLNAKKHSNDYAEDTVSPTLKPSTYLSTIYPTSNNREKQSNETSGHWENVEISSLLEWLWPVPDGGKSGDGNPSDSKE